MASLARVFYPSRVEAPRVQQDPYALRALPQDDVFFYCKKIDNSRLVREPDPKAGGTCWSVIGAACVGVLLLTSVATLRVSSTMAGYTLEQLRAEQRSLLDEGRELDLQEAELLSPERLEKLAKGQNLTTPAPGQVFHLETRTDGTVAMVKH